MLAMIAKHLLQGIVDYAGLFPPAGLEIPQVATNYAAYKRSEQRWMLGRLVVPAQRLPELKQVAQNAWTATAPWRLSCLTPIPNPADSNWRDAWGLIEAFNRDCAPGAIVDTIETKADHIGDIANFSHTIDSALQTFWELPLDARLPGLVTELAAIDHPGHWAKIRTGGIVASAFPAAELVAGFIRTCSDLGVGWKATAGLHHPLRGNYRLTYEPHSPCGSMFGYLNMFLAAAIDRFYRPAESEIIALLWEENPEHLEWSADAIRWRDWVVEINQVRTLRETTAVSFGSCSFTEPVDELSMLWPDIFSRYEWSAGVEAG